MMLLTRSLLGVKTHRNLSIAFTLLATILFLLPAGGMLSNAMRYQLPIPADKLAHGCIHLFLTFTWFWYVARRYPKPNRILFQNATIAILLFYGIVIETLQYAFVPSRHADVFDVLANGIGLLVGILLYSLLRGKLVKS